MLLGAVTTSTRSGARDDAGAGGVVAADVLVARGGAVDVIFAEVVGAGGFVGAAVGGDATLRGGGTEWRGDDETCM